MEIHLSPQICEKVADFKIAVIHYQNIEVGPSPQMLKGRLQLFQESLFFELEDKKVADVDGIAEWRTVFKQTGKDPNRYRHSAEALYRRVQKHQYLSTVNSAIDVNNFFSLQYQIPLGIYDMKALSGDITMRLGTEDEEYIGLNGRANNIHNLIVTADDQGPFGSPFVDSERSAVSESTKDALQIVYLRPSLAIGKAEKMVQSLEKMFVQIHGGDSSYKIISC
ncbi:hypothetical protein EKG37_18375 [Robertmurraya yapensis]|uniref:B3/B4 tRNA-binding domain-containing protein n=1 Tax=Bacillus yapensis TaxID=2492960 RepID=A0A3S0RGJ3_9BACI|nr:phenylalanine--tRNA ligase beta subunit-related protein [Bacillus yapensis]RTR27857.1 hypothetical protein EKG37_18375 [Bacillus yapensis]TKS94260.1 hypothetical protein FAR12_18385 [Bacillus yapensis]